MGQKTNPNSFHIQSRVNESPWTIFSKSEYSYLVKQEIGFTETIQNFFEKHNFAKEFSQSWPVYIEKERANAPTYHSPPLLRSPPLSSDAGRLHLAHAPHRTCP